ncbi:MAG: hypothetical protein AAB373_05175 [Patescibacteria group bacterium]
MIHDKIQLAIKDLQKLQDELKECKKEIKEEEKIEDEKYNELKKGMKEMKDQVKEFEDNFLEGLKKSDFYNKMREERLKAEEDLALAREKLFKLLEEVPFKAFEFNVNNEDGFTKIQALPEMKIFVNGKEIKKG